LTNQSSRRFGLIVRRVLEIAFVVLFLVQIYLNVVLHRRVRGLEAALRNAQQSAASEVFRIGDVLQPLPVRTLDGRDIVLDPTAARMNTMLLVVDPACDACRAAAEDVKKGNVKGRGIIILSVVETGTKEFAAQYQVGNFTYILLPNVPMSLRIKLSHPPTVLLLNPHARVTRVCDRPLNCA
jgi:hypothetical protein